MQFLTALISGLVFGIGLILSGMTNPDKILGFLDITGIWDPSLTMVMLGAIGVAFFAFGQAASREDTLLHTPLHLPTARNIDRRLVLGSLAFGAGWGLAGYCPGPALASLATGNLKAVIFTAAMLAGMLIFELLKKCQSRRQAR